MGQKLSKFYIYSSIDKKYKGYTIVLEISRTFNSGHWTKETMTTIVGDQLMSDLNDLLRGVQISWRSAFVNKVIEIVGTKYSFASIIDGTDFQVLVGTITGVSYTNGHGLMLQVSNYEFDGFPIWGIFFDPNSKSWTLITSKKDSVDIRNFTGEFKLYVN